MKDSNKQLHHILIDISLMVLLFGLFALPLTSFGLTTYKQNSLAPSGAVLSDQDYIYNGVEESTEATSSTLIYR
ncbi:MAG: hypothetical protein ACOZAO_01515 [Patescibacteria group bacterium]